jgi:hypothetical protein
LIGRAVEVTAAMPLGQSEKFSSVISYASPLVDNGAYRVWCDVENRQHKGHWILRPGMFATLTVDLTSTPAELAARSAP